MPEIPYGYCHCGCGGKTNISGKNNKQRGYKKGDHYRFIGRHHIGGATHASWNGGKTIDPKGGHPMTLAVNHPRSHSNGYVYDHVLRAEKTLSKPLPESAVIHHHTPDEIIICQDQSYHMLIERRTRAYNACGHANWRWCCLCKKWDAPEKLYIPPRKGSAYHPSCHAKAELKRRNQDG